jgi:hypothetical protein
MLVSVAAGGAAMDVLKKKILNWLTYPAIAVGLILRLIA